MKIKEAPPKLAGCAEGLLVHPWGVEPQSLEPESNILSIELWVLEALCCALRALKAVRLSACRR